MKGRQILTFTLIMGYSLILMGCQRVALRMYTGSPRPLCEVAIVESGSCVRGGAIDGLLPVNYGRSTWVEYLPGVQVLPGRHTFVVYFCTYVPDEFASTIQTDQTCKHKPTYAYNVGITAYLASEPYSASYEIIPDSSTGSVIVQPVFSQGYGSYSPKWLVTAPVTLEFKAVAGHRYRIECYLWTVSENGRTLYHLESAPSLYYREGKRELYCEFKAYDTTSGKKVFITSAGPARVKTARGYHLWGRGLW